MMKIKYKPKGCALTSEAIMALEGNDLVFPNKMETAIYRAMLSASDLLQKYDRLVLVFPKYVSYPPELVRCILRYWQIYHKSGTIIENAATEQPSPGTAYFTLDDKDLATLIAMSNMLGYIMGCELGFISLGDSPVKKLLGLTILAIEPVDAGLPSASLFDYLHVYDGVITTRVIRRESL